MMKQSLQFIRDLIQFPAVLRNYLKQTTTPREVTKLMAKVKPDGYTLTEYSATFPQYIFLCARHDDTKLFFINKVTGQVRVFAPINTKLPPSALLINHNGQKYCYESCFNGFEFYAVMSRTPAVKEMLEKQYQLEAHRHDPYA